MLGRVFSAIFVVLLGWLLGRVLGQRRPMQQPRRKVAKPPTSDGAMVRDRVCNTFLPRNRALTASVDGQEHFFCSERCRRRFLDGVAAAAPSRPGRA